MSCKDVCLEDGHERIKMSCEDVCPEDIHDRVKMSTNQRALVSTVINFQVP
jgi:hypothetical protein